MAVNAYYETQYNTRIGVDDVPGIFEQWRVDSARVREALTCHLEIPYGEANRETIDLFPAENSTRWMLFIHGGYWRVMTSGDFSFLAEPFVKAGWNVALVEYDLCPAVTMATLTEQVRRGVAWLMHHASDYSAGCDELIITGHSAGGHLTGMMFATDWSAYGVDATVIKGGIAISGLLDLAPIAETAMNDDLKLDSVAIAAFSPVRLKPRVSAPLVLAVGERESLEFHRQSHILKGAPAWDSIATEPVVIMDCHHFNILDDFMNLNGQMWSALDI